MSILFKPINNNIKAKLSSFRKNVEDNDIFLNEDHKLLCFYYNKYIELKSKLETKNKKIIFKFMRNILNLNENNTLIVNEFENKIEYELIKYEYNIKYNLYNKKYVNKLNYIFNYDYINIFLQEQYLFLRSLTTRELYNIKYYTYHGDIYLNAFIQGIFSIDFIIKYSGNLVSHENDLCYFLGLGTI